MPYYNEKYYIYKETQKLFKIKLVITRDFTQKAIQQLFIDKSLKKQCYFYPQIITSKSI